MVDLLPTVDSDIGPVECLPVVVFNQLGQPVGGGLEALGQAQVVLTTTTPYAVSAPAGTTLILARVEAADARWKDDGTDPTTAVGMPLLDGETLRYDADSQLRFIAQASGAILNLAFYGVANA